jgi:hypothetical protein
MRTLLAAALAAVAWAASIQPPSGQVQPPADGAGEIRGRVTAADTGRPLRHVQVTLVTIASRPSVEAPAVPVEAERPDPSVMPGGSYRQLFTDDAGSFVFSRLAPGSYRVTANPATTRPQYLAATHGAIDPTQSGRVVQLEEGDRVSGIDVVVPRAAVITGRVTDATGDAVARANVYGLLFKGADVIRTGSGMTDDVGRFRIYGLAPGEYVVVAEFRAATGATGYMPTFAPGTTNPRLAARLRARAGQETAADIRMTEGHVFRITGTVVNGRGEPVPRADIQVARRDPFGQLTSVGATMDPQARFSVGNLPPGEYRLVARSPDPGAAGPGVPRAYAEMAIEMVTVGRADVTGLRLALRPGTTITGTIAYDAPAAAPARLRVMTAAPDRWRSSVADASVDAVGNSFTLRNVSGERLIRVYAPSGGWTLKSVLLNGRDVTDVPTRFGPQDDGRLQVVLTSRAASIEGTVMARETAAGQYSGGGLVVLFGQDPVHWFGRSIMFRTMPIGPDGTFRIYHLRPGRYFALALPPSRATGIAEPPREVFEAMTREATSVTLGADERSKLELRIGAAEAR